MSESSGAWYHCTRCGSLFKAPATSEQRGHCPSCASDPTGNEESAGPAMVRVRRKVRKPKSDKKRRHRHRSRKARALMIFVILWGFVLGLAAIVMKRRWPDEAVPAVVDDSSDFSGQTMEDQRLIKDHLGDCRRRLLEFLAASDVGARSVHVLRADQTLPRMVRHQQFNPILASAPELTADYYKVIHTPAGRAIETLWTDGQGQLIEAVFFEEDGEWKLDWDAFVRAGSEPWGLFLAGKGDAEGEFRVLARERIGANGRSPDYIGLVLYAQRPGQPAEAVAPSPEIRVKRNSDAGRIIEETFVARTDGIGAFASELVTRDPAEMIRLRARISRTGEDERQFELVELLANHWLEMPRTSK